MELGPEKIVDFHEWCDKCEYKDREEKEDPCFDCLADPTNEYSHRPTKYKEKD